MRTIETTVYKLTELTETAQANAHSNYLCEGLEFWHLSDAVDSLKAFADIFPVRIKNYSLGPDRGYIALEFTGDDDIENLTGQRLAVYLWNNYRSVLLEGKYRRTFYRDNGDLRHRKLTVRKIESTNPEYDGKYAYTYKDLSGSVPDCPLTGMCYDYELLNPIQAFIQAPNEYVSFANLMQECVDNLELSVRRECEDRQTFESFKEDSEVNEWEYTETGELA